MTHDREMHELKTERVCAIHQHRLVRSWPMILLAILVSSYADVLSKCAAAADGCTFDTIVGLVGRAQCFSTILGYLLAIFVFPSFLAPLPSAECRSHDLGFPSSPALRVRRTLDLEGSCNLQPLSLKGSLSLWLYDVKLPIMDWG